MMETTGFGKPAGANITSAELLRECGRKLTDSALWQIFEERFHRTIVTYVVRTLQTFEVPRNTDLVNDLVQDIYTRLVQNGGRLLTGFLGDSDYSVLAFLGRTSMNVVSDFHRSRQAEKRQAAEVISFEEARHSVKSRELSGELDIASILGWIDVQRLVQSDPDRKHARRNLLVFQLHYIQGLTPEEISHHPGFHLSKSTAEKTIKNLRVKLQGWIGQ